MYFCQTKNYVFTFYLLQVLFVHVWYRVCTTHHTHRTQHVATVPTNKKPKKNHTVHCDNPPQSKSGKSE